MNIVKDYYLVKWSIINAKLRIGWTTITAEDALWLEWIGKSQKLKEFWRLGAWYSSGKVFSDCIRKVSIDTTRKSF